MHALLWARACGLLAQFSCFLQQQHGSYLCRRTSSQDGIVPGEKCGLPFKEFTRNTHELRRLCSSEDCCAYVREREKWHPQFVDVHITDQSSCTFLPDGESLVDYIGTTETLNDDWHLVRNLILTAHCVFVVEKWLYLFELFEF